MNGTRRVRPSSVTATVTPFRLASEAAAISRATAPAGRSAVKRSMWIRSLATLRSSKAPSAASIIGPGPQMNQPSTSAASGTSAGDRLVQPLAVEHAVEQLDVLLLGIEEMIDLEPAEMLVLERRERFEEDDRAAVAVAVEQGEAALRLLAQQGPDQRHDRRDPRPARDADEMAPVRRTSKSVVKLPCGGMTSTVSPAFSWSPTQLENSPPPIRLTVTIQSPLGGRGAQRIIAPHFLAVDASREASDAAPP